MKYHRLFPLPDPHTRHLSNMHLLSSQAGKLLRKDLRERARQTFGICDLTAMALSHDDGCLLLPNMHITTTDQSKRTRIGRYYYYYQYYFHVNQTYLAYYPSISIILTIIIIITTLLLLLLESGVPKLVPVSSLRMRLPV